MPDPITNPDPAPAGGAVPPITTTEPPVATTFDPSKVSDEDFAKVFDDPRTFNHSRFKELTDRANKAKEYEAQEEKTRQAKLLEEKKFTELIAEKDAKITELTTSQKTSTVNLKILAEAQKVGVVDADTVLQLIDRNGVTLNDDGTVTGVSEAITKLLEAKPFLKGTGQTTTPPEIGGATNPGAEGSNQLKRFKHSQILDPKFYADNEADIMASMKAGLIENDI